MRSPRPGNPIQLDGPASVPTIGTGSPTSFVSGVFAANDGTEYGKYDVHLYGRCKYSRGPRAIYGTDKYGDGRSKYW